MVVIKPLHIAEDLPSLKKLVSDYKKQIDCTNASAMRRALPTLLTGADSRFKEGDEEAAFLLYMRFAELAQSLDKQKKVSQHDKTDYRDDLEKAIDRCEQLTESLKERYMQSSLEKDLLACPAPPQTAVSSPALPNGSVHTLLPRESASALPAKTTAIVSPAPKVTQIIHTPDNKLANNSVIVESTSILDNPILKGPQLISCQELKALLAANKALVLDCRSAKAFTDSHISITQNIINIPKIYPGITAHSISESLSAKDKALFDRRKSFEKVVVVDWDGQNHSEVYSRPNCVDEALKKWINFEESITCYHLKNGYKFWLSAYPHDTSNSKPNVILNETNDGQLDKGTRAIAPQAEDLRSISWFPEEFERKVQVVPTPEISTIVAPKPEAQSTASVVPVVVDNKTLVDNQVPFIPPFPGTIIPAVKPTVPIIPQRPVAAKRLEESELSKIDKTSQDTVKQFTKSVNDKILTQKPRTLSEAETPSPLDYRLPKANLMRSRSMGDIYEESSQKDSFNKTAHESEPVKRPSIDRSLKPSNSLDAATIHKPKESIPNNSVPIPATARNGINQNNHNNIRVVKPSIPPKTRRSQSPVQAYLYGQIDRTTGLRNLRNTCYMNSVLQALAHSIEFAQYFVRREHAKQIMDAEKSVLPTLFAQLLANLWSQNDTRDVLTVFREYYGSRVSMYKSTDQQDSHEFLVSLLTTLHDDLNVPINRNRKNPIDDPDHVITFSMLPTELNNFYDAHCDKQTSVVTKNFEGILLSGLKCQSCENDSYTFQVFTVLSVPVPSQWAQLDLQACFDQFFREETVDEWLCPHCKKKRTATKQMKIARLPKHLIIHLIRFKNESWNSSSSTLKKVTNRVQFTEELDTRDFAQYVYSKNVQLRSYKLYALVKHYGTLSNGHYVAECRFLSSKQAQPWYLYNDNEVTPLRNYLDVENAYMLFYSCANN